MTLTLLPSTPIPEVLTGWPQGELAPAVAAALDNPRTGFLIFDGDLVCLHSSSNAGLLLGMACPRFAEGVPVVQSLRATGSLADEFMGTLEKLLLSAVHAQ